MLGTLGLSGAIIYLGAFFMSVVIHEVAHAYVALMFGDRTAKNQGRITLNPIPHIDPIGSIALPGLLLLTGSPYLFGWAKPVPVNPYNLRPMDKGYFWVAAAGPLSNLVIAIALRLLLVAITVTGVLPYGNVLLLALYYAFFINVVLMVFNLLPIYPLDGSKIVESLLKGDARNSFASLEKHGTLILMIVIITGFHRPLISWSIMAIDAPFQYLETFLKQI